MAPIGDRGGELHARDSASGDHDGRAGHRFQVVGEDADLAGSAQRVPVAAEARDIRRRLFGARPDDQLVVAQGRHGRVVAGAVRHATPAGVDVHGSADDDPRERHHLGERGDEAVAVDHARDELAGEAVEPVCVIGRDHDDLDVPAPHVAAQATNEGRVDVERDIAAAQQHDAVHAITAVRDSSATGRPKLVGSAARNPRWRRVCARSRMASTWASVGLPTEKWPA